MRTSITYKFRTHLRKSLIRKWKEKAEKKCVGGYTPLIRWLLMNEVSEGCEGEVAKSNHQVINESR